MTKTFLGDLQFFESKIKNKEYFSFSKYADGEMYILKNIPINNGEFNFNPNDSKFSIYRQYLIDSIKYHHPDYYVGIGCPCCMGNDFLWYKEFSCQNESNLTWANLWVNSNYEYYLKNIIPLYSEYETILVCNNNASLNNLPFKIKKSFSIGHNAWINNYSIIDEIKEYININSIYNRLFLFCAGPFGNILSHQLFYFNKDNIYLDIGSTLDPFLFPDKTHSRQYHIKNSKNAKQTCMWE